MKKILSRLIESVQYWIMRFITARPIYELEAVYAVTSDWPTRPVDVVFFHGRARGDDNELLFHMVADLIKTGMASYVMINGADGERKGGTKIGESWEGKGVFTARLVSLGVPRDKIIYCKRAYDTYEENQAMHELASDPNYHFKTAVIVGQPHQLIRSLRGLVYIMSKSGYWIRTYCMAPKTCDWFENTSGSQGMKNMERYKHIRLEHTRLWKYRNNLASAKKLLWYYQHRDALP